jgi:Arc/MetJ family transcription regulator
MKTAVDISPELLERAKRVLQTRTIRDTVDRSLRLAVRQGALEDLANAAGTVDLTLTVTSLRQQRRKRAARASR